MGLLSELLVFSLFLCCGEPFMFFLWEKAKKPLEKAPCGTLCGKHTRVWLNYSAHAQGWLGYKCLWLLFVFVLYVILKFWVHGKKTKNKTKVRTAGSRALSVSLFLFLSILRQALTKVTNLSRLELLILLPQPARVLGFQACTTTPGGMASFSHHINSVTNLRPRETWVLVRRGRTPRCHEFKEKVPASEHNPLGLRSYPFRSLRKKNQHASQDYAFTALTHLEMDLMKLMSKVRNLKAAMTSGSNLRLHTPDFSIDPQTFVTLYEIWGENPE
ncbi:protein FAM209B [Heterocephalus glaber]|uniref:Protein FAM209B n=1 Tax=Heterocephalus glaber TaxID=10181 RepID=A0AAX6SPN7_HETGA|nr:protein FAM209B [Heterocephalus glaber]